MYRTKITPVKFDVDEQRRLALDEVAARIYAPGRATVARLAVDKYLRDLGYRIDDKPQAVASDPQA